MFLWFLLFVSSLVNVCLGDTEIVNFAAHGSQHLSLPFTHKWPILRPGASELRFNITSARSQSDITQEPCRNLENWSLDRPEACPHEIWAVLDLDQDQWKKFDKLTLRISWPAYHPTRFTMAIYDPPSLSKFSSEGSSTEHPTTRTKYARTQLVHTGVLTPWKGSSENTSRYDVSFILVLEPLHFGVLPESVIPTVLAILAAIAIALPVALRINKQLQKLAQEIRNESKIQAKKN
ncbi:hypothetical protein D9613_004323 [Agrocybe pediades]|uniref:Uncharacterized protein n=1 Tax=Agrocybe pediades TaxID=84607 RepID=A0A8H4VJE5_9AGAR|nr:hypothetical protein D9613_004323 [Agrocybe pediades]